MVGLYKKIFPNVSFFWPALPARGFPMRILLFGYMEQNHSQVYAYKCIKIEIAEL